MVSNKKIPIIGLPTSRLRTTQLPLLMDVMRCVYFRNGTRATFNKLALEILELWKIAGVNTMGKKGIIRKMQQHFDNLKRVLKFTKCSNFKIKAKKLQEDYKKLFDVAKCNCNAKFQDCSCYIFNKAKAFLLDQRTERTKYLCRKSYEISPSPSCSQSCSQDSNSINETSTSDTECSTGLVFDRPATRSHVKILKTKLKNIVLQDVAQLSYRYGCSDRATAAIASSALKAAGVVTDKNTSLIIDKNKIRRAKEHAKKSFESKRTTSIKSIYFDGRIDSTLTAKKVGRFNKNLTINEEHFALLSEPGSVFIGHCSPECGTALCITDSILQTLQKKKILTDFIAAGCDGTVVNTGVYGGIIRIMEERLEHPLQWFICLLHLNELPLRHLFQYLDGKTTGPATFSGEIGKQLINCQELPLQKFKKISVNLPDLLYENLSTEQKYLYEICKAVSSGVVSEDLQTKFPGNICQSRWLTTANNILRLYVSTENPSKALNTLATYVCRVYAPMWFRVKMNSFCYSGAKNLWFLFKSTRYLPKEILKIIDPVLQRNGFFGHPENILIAMLCDKNSKTRQNALQFISKLKKPVVGEEIRRFVLPNFNFNAKTYINMVDLKSTASSFPPILMNIPENELENLVHGNSLANELKFPCHTQAVERTVKLITQVSKQVVGAEKRDAAILNILKSRAKMPKFDSKQDFV